MSLTEGTSIFEQKSYNLLGWGLGPSQALPMANAIGSNRSDPKNIISRGCCSPCKFFFTGDTYIVGAPNIPFLTAHSVFSCSMYHSLLTLNVVHKLHPILNARRIHSGKADGTSRDLKRRFCIIILFTVHGNSYLKLQEKNPLV